MQLHFILMLSAPVTQGTRTSILMQLASAPVGDPLWARLLVAGLPSLFALAIAWFVFSWNRRKDHRQWVLDNKRSEWQLLLELAAEVERFMPSVAIGAELIGTVHAPEFREHLRDMTRATLKCVFISQAKAEQIYECLFKAQLTNEQAKGHIEDQRSNPSLAHSLGKPSQLQAAKNVQIELIGLWREVRRLAAEDLGIGGKRNWWRAALDRLKRPQAKHMNQQGL